MCIKNLIAPALLLLPIVAGTAHAQNDVSLRNTLPPTNGALASPFAFRDAYGVPGINQNAPLITFRGNGQPLTTLTFQVTGRDGTAALTDISNQTIGFGVLFFPSIESFTTGWNAFEQQRPPLVETAPPINSNWGTPVAILPGGIYIWQLTLALPAWVVPNGQLAGVRLDVNSPTFLSALPLANGAGNVDPDWYGRAFLFDGVISTTPAPLPGANQWFAAEIRALPVPQPSCLADVAGGTATTGPAPDGTIDGTDFIAFINSFSIGDTAVDPLADVAGSGSDGLDPDGTIDGSDFIAFINAFAAGC